MNAVKTFTRLMAVLSLLAFLPISLNNPIVGISSAKAQKASSHRYKRSGAGLARGRQVKQVRTNVKRARSGVQSRGIGSAVVRRKTVRNNRIIRNRVGSKRSVIGDIRFIERRRQIERRNDRVANQNHLRRVERRLARQPVAVDNFNGGSGYQDGSVYGSGQGAVYSGNSCPSGHNCGVRLYSNGTGPRIITLSPSDPKVILYKE